MSIYEERLTNDAEEIRTKVAELGVMAETAISNGFAVNSHWRQKTRK